MATNTIDDTGLKYVYEKLDNKKVEKVDGKGLSTNDYTTDEKNKLAGISVNANKVEASETNGNIKIDSTETLVYDDTELQAKTSISTATAQGNPISFSTLSAQNSEATEVGIEPIQDLHGYSKPWVGGAGKNLLPMTVQAIKDANTSGTWSGNEYTLGAAIFTINTDDANNVTSIKVTGSTGSAVRIFALCSNVTFPANSYILNGGVDSNNIIYDGTSAIMTGNADFPFTLSEATQKTFSIRVSGNQTLPTAGITFYPMIRLSTVSDATFEPYTNFCPIFPGVYSKNLCPWDEVKISNTTYTSKEFSTPLPAGTYTISTLLSNEVNAGARIYFRKSDGTAIENAYVDLLYVQGQRTSGTVNLTEPAYYVYFYYRAPGYTGTRTWSDIQIELGSTATSYEPYNTHKIEILGCGENVWDEQWEVGGLNGGTGQKETRENAIRCKDFIRVIPNTSYYMYAGTGTVIDLAWYDTYKNYISGNSSASKNTERTSPSNAKYLMFSVRGYGSTYNNDVAINYPSTDTEYNAYQSSNNILLEVGQDVYGGKFIPETGVLTVDRAYKDLGDLTWTKNDSSMIGRICFYATISNINAGSALVACSNYEIKRQRSEIDATGQIAPGNITTSTYIVIRDDDKNGLTGTEFKTAMAGVQLVYELATPITIQLTPNQIALLQGANYLSTNCQNLKLTYRIGEMATLNDIKGLDDRLREVEEIADIVSANNPGTRVDISGYDGGDNKYVCPSDGYIELNSNTATSGNIRMILYGADNNVIAYQYMRITGEYQIDSLFVRKGMKCKINAVASGATINFIPLI